MDEKPLLTFDPWGYLKAYTPARIALGRSASSLPTSEVLRFGYAHAQARDAVHAPLDVGSFCAGLQASDFDARAVQSAAWDRYTYLLRPDLGRQLDAGSVERLLDIAPKGWDVLPVVGDGLSALAVSSHARAVLERLRAAFCSRWNVGPVIVATQARVALSDHIGELLQARLVVMLIGERPGLTSPDSLGIYITYQPRIGRRDAERNCISNIRAQGMDYETAARKTAWLVQQAMQRRLSGIGLKDQSDLTQISGTDAPSPAGGAGSGMSL